MRWHCIDLRKIGNRLRSPAPYCLCIFESKIQFSLIVIGYGLNSNLRGIAYGTNAYEARLAGGIAKACVVFKHVAACQRCAHTSWISVLASYDRVQSTRAAVVAETRRTAVATGHWEDGAAAAFAIDVWTPHAERPYVCVPIRTSLYSIMHTYFI